MELELAEPVGMMGDMKKHPASVMENLLEKALPTHAVDASGCWLLATKTNDKGYAYLCRRLDGINHTIYGHRLFYWKLVGPIPDELELDHTCRNPACVNPEHVEPVTHIENMMRGRYGDNARKTHCPHGHALSGDNLVPHRLPIRNCLTCRRRGAREYSRRRRAERARV